MSARPPEPASDRPGDGARTGASVAADAPGPAAAHTPRRARADASILKGRLRRSHFALARGWVQGLELRVLAERYLPPRPDDGGTPDLRVAKTTLEFVLDDVAAAARREGVAPREAALLARHARLIRVPAGVPTLAEFARTLGGADFGSEAELLERYASTYGERAADEASARAQARRARLVERQLALLHRLERRTGAELALSDALADWFAQGLVARMSGAGIVLVAQLVDLVEDDSRWWRAMPGVGPAKAERIERFLAHALWPQRALRPALARARRRAGAPAGDPGAGLRLQDRGARGDALAVLDADGEALRPDALVFGVVPIERLEVPQALDGSTGRFRAPIEHCTIRARNDLELVETWLATKDSTHTRRSYRKEAERFVLWSVVARGQPVSSTRLDDALAYRDFVADPRPPDAWCAPRHLPRHSRRWRPFEGPLSRASQSFALTVLHNLFEFGCRTGYLAANPWSGLRAGRAANLAEAERSTLAGDTDADAPAGTGEHWDPLARALSHDEWAWVVDRLERQPECGRTRRLRFVLTLAYSTGLRLTELVRARREHLVFLPATIEEPSGWVLRVLGKRRRLRSVPLADEVVSALRRYLRERRIDEPLERVPAGTFLIGQVDDLAQRMPAAPLILARQRAAAAGRDPDAPEVALGARLSPYDGVKGARIYRDVAAFFDDCADALLERDPDGAQRLRRATTHWLRHTFASHALEDGLPLDVVRETLGHQDLATTSRYVRTEERRRLREIRRVRRVLPG